MTIFIGCMFIPFRFTEVIIWPAPIKYFLEATARTLQNSRNNDSACPES